MRVSPSLDLNQNPQNCQEGTLMFAKNMKLESDGGLVSDYGYKEISALSSLTIVGHIVGLDDLVYIFTNNSKIYEYNEKTEVITEIKCGWTYSNGEIDGCVTTNVTGEKILTVAEYISGTTTLIPLKHINLSHCASTDDESIYCQAPKVPMCNLLLNTTYAKTIPNGTYVFFIRYKIRTDCYTNWYLCSCPIFGGTATRITTLQGGVSYINYHTDSAKSFVFDISFIGDIYKAYYQGFQLGFILAHDDSTNARSWKEFGMDTTKVYFDYEGIEEVNIDDLLATTYELYNIRNVTSFKNKLYIGNYVESDLNPDITSFAENFTLGYAHSDPTGSGDKAYKTMNFNGNALSYNYSKGFYDKTTNGYSIASLLGFYMFDYEVSDLYKNDTIEKDKICTFNMYWSAENNPDLCPVYNISNSCYNKAIFGSDYTTAYGEGRLGIREVSYDNNLWCFDRNTSNPHPWDTLGFTFCYGSTNNQDVTKWSEMRNGTLAFSKYTKHWGISGRGDDNYWIARDNGYGSNAKAFMKSNTTSEIEAKSRLIYCYLEVSSGASTYKIGYDSYMSNDNYVGLDTDEDFGYDNANANALNYWIEYIIKLKCFEAIYNNVVGIDDNGSLVLYIGGDYIHINSATAIFRAIKFSTETDDVVDTDGEIGIEWTVNAKITEWRSLCNFDLKEGYITVDDTAENSISQKSTLMPLSKYEVYAHLVTNRHIITNGALVQTIDTDAAKSNTDTLHLKFTLDNISGLDSKYVGYFLSIADVGNKIIECFDYRKDGTTNIVNCIEVDSLLYNINNNITVVKADSSQTLGYSIVTNSAKYYSSGSSVPVLAFGNCGYVAWTDSTDHSSDKLYILISRDNTKAKHKDLIKCTPYYALAVDSSDKEATNGFYGSYFCLVKKPTFDLSSTCYVSGNDVYSATRKAAIKLKEFSGYIQIQSSPTYFIRSNYNLNYLSLVQDINDQIFSIGNASSGIKQVARVLNSATLSYIYELKSMYKDFRNKIFRIRNADTKITFDNTLRVSAVLSDETFNNSVYKFNATDYYNIPTDRGILVKLFAVGNNIFLHTTGSFYKFDASQTIMASDQDIQLKESEPFSAGITQICDSQYGYAGLSNKHSGCVTYDSYVFYDAKSKHIFGYGGQGQIALIDNSIYKILQYFNFTNCRIIHDENNNRVIINLVNSTGKEITLDYNYKNKSFVSLHDITLNRAFNTRNNCYSYKGKFTKLFDVNQAIDASNLFGYATNASYLTDAPDEGTYKDCLFSLSIVLFPATAQRESLDNVQYVADINKNNISDNTEKTKLVMDIARNTKENPVSEFFVTTDECQSTHVTTTIDDTVHTLTTSAMLEYKGFKYNMGFWTSNYFRNNLNVTNVYKYPGQPGVDIEKTDKIKVTRVPNTDNYSLVYGRYFILTFGFINTKPIKFENVLVNSKLY